MNGTRPPMPQHVSTVFTALFDELKTMKQQQWKITNYAIALLAAAYALKVSDASHFHSILNLVVAITAIVGSGLLLRVQYNMARPRARLDAIHVAYFTRVELENIGLSLDEINGLRNQTFCQYFCKGLEFVIALIAVLVVGWLLVCLAL